MAFIMDTDSANNKRIAKNTLLLYFRMLLTMLITLYTSRVILQTLGVEDYGIYNVVGGIVALFMFLNNAMSASTQRYLTYELGRGDEEGQKKVFSTCLYIHLILAGVIFIVAETIGLWFLYAKMNIPIERQNAAVVVYHMSVLCSIISILIVPFNATIIAHEKMNVFAYISIFDVTMKLLSVYLLLFFDYDKLAMYAFLILLIHLFDFFLYIIYSKGHFKEIRLKIHKEQSLFKEMLSYTSWNLFGGLAFVATTQGLNILLNIFFSPIVNAARAIAVQVQAAVMQFANNFQMAINPQITKSYARDELNYMHFLMFCSSKVTFYLLFFISIPLFICTREILELWLKSVPDYSVSFVRFLLIASIIDAVANPMMIASAATGKIRNYQIVVGGNNLLVLPLSYMALNLYTSPELVFGIQIVICIISFFLRLYIISPLVRLSKISYMRNVMQQIFVVLILTIIVFMLIKHFFHPHIIILSIMLMSVFLFFISLLGFNYEERKYLSVAIYRIKQKLLR